MSSIEASLYYRLTNHAGLSALISARAYPMKLPQSVTLPAVTYFQVSGPRVSAMGSDPGLTSPRFQVSAWAEDYDGAKDVAVQIRAALQRWRGTMQNVVIQDTFIESERDLYEDETETWQVAVDVIIHHEE